jgi:hypothetical protein
VTNNNNTRAIETLLEIMNNDELTTRRRIEAAEHLLGFEAPADTVTQAREYLVSVFEDRDAEINDRMDALKIARRSEAPKVTPRVVRFDPPARSERDRREAWRHYEISKLKMKIYRATGTTPLGGSGWADHLQSDDYVAPPGDEWPDWSKGD